MLLDILREQRVRTQFKLSRILSFVDFVERGIGTYCVSSDDDAKQHLQTFVD